MTDFAALIERAIERDLRSRFITFLASYEHVEFGRARELTLGEAALVLACTDRFLLDTNVLDLGVAGIVDLRARLHSIAQRPGTPAAAGTALANTCFDALACITALEARLCRLLDRVEVRVSQRRHCPSQCPANDS
jgi:hypothetical protein